jgi:hypothetical protein
MSAPVSLLIRWPLAIFTMIMPICYLGILIGRIMRLQTRKPDVFAGRRLPLSLTILPNAKHSAKSTRISMLPSRLM